MPVLLMIFLVTVLGLLIGSFLNVVIYRLPLMLQESWEAECKNFLQPESYVKQKIFNLLFPRSHCPQCKNILSLWCNVPVFSFLFLRGKCHSCAANISWRYPVVEIISALSSFFVFYYFGPTLQALIALLLTWGLIAAFFIDLETQILPDQITLPFLWMGLLANAINLYVSPQESIIGAASAYVSLWLIARIFKLVRKIEGMGHGDFKLFAVFGAFLGWQVLPFILAAAAFLGSIVGLGNVFLRKKNFYRPIAFGPYLVVSGWVALFCHENILYWWLQ